MVSKQSSAEVSTRHYLVPWLSALNVLSHYLLSSLVISVGIPFFGPSLEAAAMEGSKAFAKEFMDRHSIPTASYRNFGDYDAALEYVQSISHRVVIKASGLANGKGVLLPLTTEEAIQGLKSIMVTKDFGHSGDEVVIEEFLEGQELSILAFSMGTLCCPSLCCPFLVPRIIRGLEMGTLVLIRGGWVPTLLRLVRRRKWRQRLCELLSSPRLME